MPVMFRVIALCVCSLCVGGCRSSAPMHVWQPPRLETAVGKKVVLSSVTGPEEVTAPLKRLLLSSAPSDPGRATSLIAAESLPKPETIRLASAFDDEPNDLVLASLSRQSGADYLWRGEVIGHDQSSLPSSTLQLSWGLISLSDGGKSTGMPIVVDHEKVLERYPDLAFVQPAEQQLLEGAARDSLQLIAPWIDRQTTRLSRPYFMPGSREVRRGNLSAQAGNWGEAEAIWESVWQRYPTQIAALHNLALAAAAGQDFSRARKLARRAVRLSPTALHKNTMVWIELMQRDYHDAFGLPDPPEGWFISRR